MRILAGLHSRGRRCIVVIMSALLKQPVARKNKERRQNNRAAADGLSSKGELIPIKKNEETKTTSKMHTKILYIQLVFYLLVVI